MGTWRGTPRSSQSYRVLRQLLNPSSPCHSIIRPERFTASCMDCQTHFTESSHEKCSSSLAIPSRRRSSRATKMLREDETARSERLASTPLSLVDGTKTRGRRGRLCPAEPRPKDGGTWQLAGRSSAPAAQMQVSQPRRTNGETFGSPGVGSAQARRGFLLVAYIIIRVNAKDKSPPSVPLGKHRATIRVALKRLPSDR